MAPQPVPLPTVDFGELESCLGELESSSGIRVVSVFSFAPLYVALLTPLPPLEQAPTPLGKVDFSALESGLAPLHLDLPSLFRCLRHPTLFLLKFRTRLLAPPLLALVACQGRDLK